ncbi:hypothetical protein BD779DRAFT_1435934 [Infundibulicybe gibba]|nr:hypothetical protein BD779DRAFT_1435934 [Infundibulicybe gibba]
MSLLILSAADIVAVTSSFQPMSLLLLQAKALTILSQSSTSPTTPIVLLPHRTSLDTEHHTALFMPARIAHPAFRATAIKVVCVPRRAGDSRGLPASTLVVNEETGSVRAIINSRSLTALRTAAGSLLSTHLVGPETPHTLLAFGTGTQADAHLNLHIKQYPSITKCTLVARSDTPRAAALLAHLTTHFPRVTFSIIFGTWQDMYDSEGAGTISDMQRAVGEADIIVCATPSATPLFPSSWVRAGTHIIAVGSYTPAMHEVDGDLLRRAVNPAPRSTTVPPLLLVDSRTACAAEAGELIDAGIGGAEVVEIGELALLRDDGEVEFPQRLGSRDHDLDGLKGQMGYGPVTIFKSVGVGVQDVVMACAVVDEAMRMGIGSVIEGYD